MGLVFKITAKNSSGKQDLFLDYNEEENAIEMCIKGKFEDKEIQFDFDLLDKQEFQEFTDYVNLMNKKIKRPE